MSLATPRRGPIRVYKNRAAGTPRKAPRCICCFPASRAGQIVPLRYGVQLALCEDHRDPGWIASRNGRDFLASVTTTMSSFGLSHRRYALAVAAFVREVVTRHAPSPRHRPGSYAWPGLRATAEGVWARGGSYHDGEAAIAPARAAFARGWRPPSAHTVRRWWREKRWLLGTPTPTRTDARSPGEREGGTRTTTPSKLVLHREPDAAASYDGPPVTQRHARPRGGERAHRAPP